MKKWRIKGANGVVLGVFDGQTQIDAWKQCVTAHDLRDEENKPFKVSQLAPGLTFETVDERDWKPTHVLIWNGKTIEVIAETSKSVPTFTNLYTRDEWINHTMNEWTSVKRSSFTTDFRKKDRPVLGVQLVPIEAKS